MTVATIIVRPEDLDLNVQDRDLGRGVFGIGKARWSDRENGWVCLADVNGCLCLVKVNLRLLPPEEQS